MWMELRSASLGAEPPKRTNGVLKSLNVHRNSTRNSTWLTGRSIGRVTERRRRQKPAPSLAAASYRSVGACCSPAIRHRNAHGHDFQTDTISSAQNELGPS